MFGKCMKDVEKRTRVQMEINPARPYRHAATFKERENAKVSEFLPKSMRAQFEGLYDEVQDTKQDNYERSVQFLKQMALVKVGSREPGFNLMYNRFAECFENSVPLNEERRIKKLIKPWIDKGR